MRRLQQLARLRRRFIAFGQKVFGHIDFEREKGGPVGLDMGARQVVALLADAVVFHANGSALPQNLGFANPDGGNPGEARAADLNFPHPAPINILLGCRRGQVKNKTNDPAAIIHPRDRWMPRIQSLIWN